MMDYNVKHQLIKKLYPCVVDLITYTELLEFSILPHQSCRNIVGGTSYIDHIKLSDMPSNKVIGIDPYDRPFVAFCVESLMQTSSPSDSLRKHPRVSINVLFQRYSSDPSTWASANCNYEQFVVTESGYFLSRGHLIHKNIKTNIYNLLNNIKWVLSCSNDKYPAQLYKIKPVSANCS